MQEKWACTDSVSPTPFSFSLQIIRFVTATPTEWEQLSSASLLGCDSSSACAGTATTNGPFIWLTLENIPPPSLWWHLQPSTALTKVLVVLEGRLPIGPLLPRCGVLFRTRSRRNADRPPRSLSYQVRVTAVWKHTVGSLYLTIVSWCWDGFPLVTLLWGVVIIYLHSSGGADVSHQFFLLNRTSWAKSWGFPLPWGIT